MGEIPEDMIAIARWVLMGHGIGTDLGEERKQRLVDDIALQMTRLADDERECCAAIANSIATDVRNSAVQRITAGKITTLIKARVHSPSPKNNPTQVATEDLGQ